VHSGHAILVVLWEIFVKLLVEEGKSISLLFTNLFMFYIATSSLAQNGTVAFTYRMAN
jgi:hypothetical protein